VPAFSHGDFSLYETSAIVRYIDEAFSGPALQPQGAQQRARMNQVMSILDNYGFMPFYTVFAHGYANQKDGLPINATEREEALSKADVCLNALEKLFENSPYLNGETICLADLYIAPMFCYFLQAPQAQQLLTKYPKLTHHWQTLNQRASIKNICLPY
jgi:glutathione S-transferase